MSDELTTRLERCYTGIIHDVMRAMGLRNFVLPPEIRSLFPDRRLAGPVFTVSGVPVSSDRSSLRRSWTSSTRSTAPRRSSSICSSTGRNACDGIRS